MSKQSKTVKYILDPGNPPALTAKQKSELQALEAKPDSEIDTSDITVLSDEDWQNAQPMMGRFNQLPRDVIKRSYDSAK